MLHDVERFEQDLRGLLQGEVLFSSRETALYASDASIYERQPLGVVRPRHVEDVSTLVKYAAEEQVPLHARGAGTALVGQALGEGIVVDFSRFMRRIEEHQDDVVRLQPGVIHAALNRQLALKGWWFGPDPATSEVTTMGSVVSVDASGSRWMRYGSARRHIQELEVVLADGTIATLGKHTLEPATSSTASSHVRDLVRGMTRIIQDYQVAEPKGLLPQSLVNVAGYQFQDILDPRTIDLAKLISGSEGTLALITGMKLTVQRRPRFRGSQVLFFERLDHAAMCGSGARELGLAACDLVDRRHLMLARGKDPRYELFIPPEAEAALILEADSDIRGEVEETLKGAVDHMKRIDASLLVSELATQQRDLDFYRGLATRYAATVHGMGGPRRPLPIVEDMAIPPEQLASFLLEVREQLRDLDITATMLAHAGHGQVHLRPMLDLRDPNDRERLQQLMEKLAQKVWARGGTVSGEHGDGLARTHLLARQYGSTMDSFRAIKHLFDPENQLNPGKIVPVGPAEPLRYLRNQGVGENGKPAEASVAEPESIPPVRQSTDRHLLPVVDLSHDWSVAAAQLEADRCNGCGICRQETGVRMCPMFHMSAREEASPRAKANLVRGLATGLVKQEEVTPREIQQLANLCVHCHMCRIECPSHVDIPGLMAGLKSHYVTNHGQRLSNRVMADIDRLSQWGHKLRWPANWMLGNRFARWGIEKSLGIARTRKLPRFARHTFMRESRRQRWHIPPSGERKVALFVDTYANLFDPQLAIAFARILNQNNVAFFVPPEQTYAGMPLISRGSFDRARQVARENVSVFAEAVRHGFDVVCVEPSAALALRHEYPKLLDNDEDATLVADHVFEAGAYLQKMHTSGDLRLDFHPVSAVVGYHAPCHLLALEMGTPAEHLLRLIPHLVVQRIEKGCSGMAGTFGLQQRYFRDSLRMGLPLIESLRKMPLTAGTTECSTCKIQMEQVTNRPTVHPLKLLALSYGIMPELRVQLFNPGRDLIVT